MCSISGIIGRPDIKNLKKMLFTQKHRGPDQSGYFCQGKINIGMGRLKIVDINNKNLCPYEDKNIVLTFNGEIYNYLELKKILIKRGHKFFTKSDIEVLAKSWIEWEYSMFDKIIGMFAFALFDKNKQKIILARDIAGEKPLYYIKKNNIFSFASEAKALKNIYDLKINKNDIFYKNFQHCLTTTLWKDLYELPAAHYLEYNIKNHKIKINEYWKLKKTKIFYNDINAQFEELLTNSIKLRTANEVPYGLYYSKGVDSTLISALHKFENKFYFNDNKNWKKEFDKKISKICYHLDFPVGSLSSFPLWKLAEMAQKKVKVVLSGEGADEIFGGYVRYLPIAREWELNKNFPSYKFLFNKFYPNFLDGFSKITLRNKDHNYVKELFKPIFESFDDPINAMGYCDFKFVMPSLLQMGDRMASAFGIENRCPFLDKNIINFGFNLKPNYKINNLNQKILLKVLLEKKGKLNLIEKEKKGLSIKFNQWFKRNDWDRTHYFSVLNKTWSKKFKIL